MQLPQEFEQKMRKLLKEDYENYADSFAKGYGQTFRVNQLKIQPAELLRRFAVKPVPWCETGFYYEGDSRLSTHPFYYGGAYYIQEPCAMAPASFLPVKPGDKVLDLCAAPGGKTTALAAKLQGEGMLIANDISISRCKALLKNMELSGVKNAVITCESPDRLSERFTGYFDCVLVDAPCSGEGMFRKDSSMMKEWSEDAVLRYSALQKEIIKRAAKMVRPGGYLLYSTCTYSPEENEQVVETLLQPEGQFTLEELPLYDGMDTGHPMWSKKKNTQLVNCRRFWNHRVDGEGQFAALLKKSEQCEENVSGYVQNECGDFYEETKPKKVKKGNKKHKEGRKEPVQKETGVVISEEMRQFFTNCSVSVFQRKLRLIEERIFLLPENCPDMEGLRIVRSGLYLGDCKKKRFEPSQALAMALRPEEYENCIDLPLNDIRVEKYLRGETIEADSKDGWILICVEGLPLGWGKSSKGSIKNKIAPGWRKK